MISIYDNATIDIISTSYDTYGKETETIAYEDLSCRVEPVNKMVINKSGGEVRADTLIMISLPGESITWSDKIKIKTIDGDPVDTADKKYVIKSKFQASGFVSSHWEIYI